MAPCQLLIHQHHVSYIGAEGAWVIGHHQAPPYVLITLKADLNSYNVFRETATFPQSIDPQVGFHACVDTFMFTNAGSDVDIITTETLRRMGYNVTSLLEVSDEGHNLFRQAHVTLMGALFVKIGVINPATRRGTYTKSLVYVADTQTERNHMSTQTVENLGLRGTAGGDLMRLYIPRNV